MKTSDVIKLLKARGVSKYRIAKQCGVSWQTVHMWEKEVFKPSPDKRAILERLTVSLRKP